MSPWISLVQHELRNTRTSLCAALACSVVLLGMLRAFACSPTQSATALPLLWSLCALQFAADSFATDSSSGRLATRAALPVDAHSLWSAKLAAYACSIAVLLGLGVALECGWSGAFGGMSAVEELLESLPTPLTALTAVALIGATGMLCSLVVDSSLTAMLLAAVVLALLVGADFALRPLKSLLSSWWPSVDPRSLGLTCAVAFLAIGATAFVCGQRALGDLRMRLRWITLGTAASLLVLMGWVGAAGMHWTRHALEDRGTQLILGSASPDGRLLALEAAPIRDGRANARFLSTAWVIDLDSGACRLLAAPGSLAPDGVRGGFRAWDAIDGLGVFDEPWFEAHGETRGLRVRAIDGELRSEAVDNPLELVEPRWPDWAAVTRGRDPASKGRTLTVAWRGTSHERRISGALPGHNFVISPRPGRVWLSNDERLIQLDLANGEERVVLSNLVRSLCPSPDGLAMIVHADSEQHVLSTSDGSALSAPWPRSEWCLRWVGGDDRSRDLMMVRVGVHAPARILDLESGRQIELASTDYNITRVGDRGFVHSDAAGDLVWSDPDGNLVKRLIARGDRR